MDGSERRFPVRSVLTRRGVIPGVALAALAAYLAPTQPRESGGELSATGVSVDELFRLLSLPLGTDITDHTVLMLIGAAFMHETLAARNHLERTAPDRQPGDALGTTVGG